MVINEVTFNADLSEILEELIRQLRANNIHYLQKTKETSTHIQVQCPYHGEGTEKRPSAGIRKQDGIFHCFACQEVHSLSEVISFCFGKYDDVLGKFGWDWLLKNFTTISRETRKPIDLNLDRRQEETKFNFVSEEELDNYRYYHPYWKKRKITDESLIELFDLGYDKITDCITMPVRDIKGNCLFVARRAVKSKFFSYPKGVEKPLYGLYELNSLDTFPTEVIVCESMIDALTAWQYGKLAVALNGLGTEKQFKELRDLPCRKLILATDADEAGMQARYRIRKNVPNKIITEYIDYPDGCKDLNDMSLEQFLNLREIF